MMVINRTEKKQSQEHRAGQEGCTCFGMFFHFDLLTMQLGANSFVRMPRRGKGLGQVAVRIK